MDNSDDYGTPRSGRKKKSLLSKMAERKAKGEDASASRESLRNISQLSLEESSLTQVSIDQSPIEENVRSRKVENSEVSIQSRLVEPITDSMNNVSQKPVPKSRVRQSLDLSDGHWSKPPVEDDDDSSPLVTSEDEAVDVIEHKVQVHNEVEPSASNGSSPRTTTNGRRSYGDRNGREIPRNGHRRRERGNNNSAANDSDSDSDANDLRAQYENALSNDDGGGGGTRRNSRSPRGPEPLALTKENLRRKESMENPGELMDSTTFTKTNRLLRLTNMSRGAAQTPTSELESTKSYATQSSLPLITTQSVRERSFLVGSMGHNSVLGAEELERLFPDRRIKVFVVTWNMFENKPDTLPRSLNDMLLPEDVEYVPDICVVKTQESCSDKGEWEIRLQETIGPTHVLFTSAFHGDLHTCVFMRRDLIWFCSIPEWDKLTFRPAVRTKGSLAIAFSMFGTSFLFLNSHFMSGDGRLDQRISDYKETITRIKLPNSSSKVFNKDAENDVTSRFDVTFWGGDMNFRIDRPRHIVDTIVQAIQEHHKHPDYEALLVGCELYRCKNEGTAFQRFQEGRINFPPTYKYDVNERHLYDTSEKMRIPSYCDRILFRTKKKQACICLYYSSVDSIKVSDHHPVCGLYEVELRPGKDSSRMAPGRFNREVYMEANRRRAEFRANPSVSANEKRSSICSVS